MALRGSCGALLACVCVLSACASDDLIVKRQTETDAKVEYLMQTNKRAETRLNDIESRLQTIEDQLKDSSVQTKQLNTSLADLLKKNEELTIRVSMVAQQSVTKIEVVNPEAPKGRDSGPPPAYVKAFGLYSANNFQGAIEAFEAFLKEQPASDYSANSLYWIAECYYSSNSLEKALEMFQKVVETYPRSHKAPDAQLKVGITLAAMKQKDRSRAAFETLIQAYPGSPAATRARERLTAP